MYHFTMSNHINNFTYHALIILHCAIDKYIDKNHHKVISLKLKKFLKKFNQFGM